jgi:hypothetical protein
VDRVGSAASPPERFGFLHVPSAPWGRRISQDVPKAGENEIASFADRPSVGIAKRAVRWSCSRCDVSVGQLDGRPTDLPVSWTRSGDSTFCLACSRALAGEAATDSAPEASSREELARVRRDAVIEFEIGRVPLAPNRTIAHACRTSPIAVAAVRGALETASQASHQGARGA